MWNLVIAAADAFHSRIASIHASPAPAVEKLRSAIMAHVAVVAENIESATIYFHEWKFLSPRRRNLLGERRDAYESMFRDMIAQGVREKTFRITDAKSTSILLLSSLNGMYTWYDPSGPLGAKQIGEMYAELLMSGMLNGRLNG